MYQESISLGKRVLIVILAVVLFFGMTDMSVFAATSGAQEEAQQEQSVQDDSGSAEKAANVPETKEADKTVKEDKADKAEKTEASAEKKEKSGEKEPAATESESKDTAYPAFEQSKTVDGVKVIVSAGENVFPEGATLSVKKVTKTERKEADAAVKKVRDNDRNIAASYTFDIKVLAKDGNELQPKNNQDVSVTFQNEEIAQKIVIPEVYHIDSETGKAEDLKVSEKKDKATVKTDGFSVYQVNFTYNDLKYELDLSKGSTVTVKDIMDAIHLSGEDLIFAVEEDPQSTGEPPEPNYLLTIAGSGLNAENWTVAYNDGKEGYTRLVIKLKGRPTYYVDVTTVNDNNDPEESEKVHEIKLLHLDGNTVDSNNKARAGEIVQIYVTGYSESKQKEQLNYKYTRQGTNFWIADSPGFLDNHFQVLEMDSAPKQGIGYKYVRIRPANPSSETTFNFKITVKDGTQTIINEKDVDITYTKSDLKKDISDVQRAINPIILYNEKQENQFSYWIK